MKEAIRSFFMTPGYGGALVMVIATALLVTYVSVARWISRGADSDTDE